MSLTRQRGRCFKEYWLGTGLAIIAVAVSVSPGVSRGEGSEPVTTTSDEPESQLTTPQRLSPPEKENKNKGKISATLAVSTGGGWQLTPELERLPHNLMVAPGVALGTPDNPVGLLRLEMGLGVNALRDGPGPTAELWPMLVLGPDPQKGIYMRLIFADLLLLPKKQTTVGMTVGIEMHFNQNGIFIEGGTMGRGLNSDGEDKTQGAWIVEGRIGVIHAF